MSGTIGSNILSHSGIVAETAAGLNWVSTVVTASTVTVEAGNGYWINTTSNACTITLPDSAEAGDNIVIVDFARTWGTNSVTLDSNGLNFQGQDDSYTVEYTTSGQSVNLIYSDATKGWIPLEDDVVADEPVAQIKAIFAYGYSGSAALSMSNKVSASGVIAADVTGVGTARYALGAATYGGNKAVFAFGNVAGPATNLKNLVSSSGVIAADVAGVGTARYELAAVGYGDDLALFAFGRPPNTAVSNKVSNSGVIASDTTGVGTARFELAAVRYGSSGEAIFAYGSTSGNPIAVVSMSNKVNSSGVVASDVTGVGTARRRLAATSYGTGLAIFAYGSVNNDGQLSMSNKVNSSGVIASDVTGVGTARDRIAATNYGPDTGIFAYGGGGSSKFSLSNKVSNSGVIASDVTGVGTERSMLAAAAF